MNKLAKNSVIHPQEIAVPLPIEVHPSVSPKAAELLGGVIAVLLKTPEKYNQQEPYSVCGSPCCIMGHMALMGYPGTSSGLTSDQTFGIEYLSGWPAHLREAVQNTAEADGHRKLTMEYATPEQGIARCEHFLRTGA